MLVIVEDKKMGTQKFIVLYLHMTIVRIFHNKSLRKM